MHVDLERIGEPNAQTVSMKKGYFSTASGESKTIFVSADKKLVKAARVEGLRAWNPEKEEPPP